VGARRKGGQSSHSGGMRFTGEEWGGNPLKRRHAEKKRGKKILGKKEETLLLDKVGGPFQDESRGTKDERKKSLVEGDRGSLN